MKKRGILFTILFLILFLAFSVNAQEVDLSKDGYKCLKKEINDKGCSELSLEEKIFSVLSTEKCKSDLLDDVQGDECWGEGTSCNTKETAQAIIALQTQDLDVDSYLPWLLAQNKISANINWFLQIDTPTSAICTLKDLDDNNYQVSIGENDKLTAESSPCFSLNDEGYWIEINSNCYGQEFEISCDTDFSTTLLFKKKVSSQAIHVLDTDKSAPGEDTITEQINSLCFKKGTSCNYEASLWATFALSLVGEDISSYLPYLIALKQGTNSKYLPDSFLYFLTDDEDFSASLNAKQKLDKYWQESGDKYYDTAVALFPFSSADSFDEKTNAITWLEEEQDNDGCWDSGDIVNTAFLLYSLWPKKTQAQEQKSDCGDEGYYCMSSSACNDAEGNELTNYSCIGFDICCSESEPQLTCEEIDGTICETGETCTGTPHTEISTPSGRICCVGACEEVIIPPEENECEDVYFGICKSSSCDNNEDEADYSCRDTSDVCCLAELKLEKNYSWLLIVLGVLLVLLILFIFRKKLFKKKLPEEVPRGSPGPRRPGMPPRRIPPRRPTPPRRAPTPQKRPAPVTRPAPRVVQPRTESGEDVLKKLKEMGK